MNLVLAQAVPGIPGANWAILALVMVMAGTAVWMIRRGMATSVE